MNRRLQFAELAGQYALSAVLCAIDSRDEQDGEAHFWLQRAAAWRSVLLAALQAGNDLEAYAAVRRSLHGSIRDTARQAMQAAWGFCGRPLRGQPARRRYRRCIRPVPSEPLL